MNGMEGVTLALIKIEMENIQVVNIHTAIQYLTALKLLRQEYTTQQVIEPKWMADRQRLLERRIAQLNEEAMEHRMSKLRSERASYLAQYKPEQRVADIDAEIKELEDKLAAR